ncbi:MAG: MerR family transcriptional regulator [Geminicoccaceae bacterium]|nr:MerR family transcriptional regulator [Geminicoccaceae bacterium]MCB9944219.1 MerR family transcriptional regulator [Geminicoccaceae bacterium]
MVVAGSDVTSGEAGSAARNGKSSSAFRTISEVADELDVAQHVLRFWESKFPQVRPLKRGGGRRYYRPEDIDLLRDIRSLLYQEGYTIKGAQKLLRQRRSKAAASRANVATPPQQRQDAGVQAAVVGETEGPATDPGDAPVPADEAADPGRERALRRIRDDLSDLRDWIGKAVNQDAGMADP